MTYYPTKRIYGQRKYALEAKERAVKALAEAFPDKDTWQEIVPFIDWIQRRGKGLHSRYENECNYQWAGTEAYQKKTEAFEASLLKRCKAFGFEHIRHNYSSPPQEGNHIYLQTDPRGWPIVLIVSGHEYRLGG